ncbi:hypothetical protein BDP55DRAFT_633089 [Colletotrichum godetiae]|uniref:Rhodopsin domain-containing protein n=1 Tax=Colletotrichum godetiae TaxID=1209918 RepID=A0AAJ0AMW2_9PEZI|nr:uncharacterized protein BDP55DRAFT_633089 [Colletotrichum godetiae]KAK1674656.1 hypothetical protein BDP55DRAFT_633089 [Colletotrichum godetiae]
MTRKSLPFRPSLANFHTHSKRSALRDNDQVLFLEDTAAQQPSPIVTLAAVRARASPIGEPADPATCALFPARWSVLNSDPTLSTASTESSRSAMNIFRDLSIRQENGSSPMEGFNAAQRKAFGVNGSLIIVIVFVMGVRLYTRFAITKSIGADDFFMIAGTSLYISRLFFAVGNVLVKLGLLLFYLRLDNRPKMRWTVYGLMAAVIGMGICHFVMSAIECNPVEAFWDAAGVIVIVTDICLWICPIPMIWGLQLPQRQKWAVSAVFALGVVCVAANEPEIYRQFASSLIWYAVELYVAIFCGCSSALKAFFKTFFPALLGLSSCKTKYPLGSNGRDGQGKGTRSSYPLQSLPSRHTGYKATITSNGRGRGGGTDIGNDSRNDSEEAIIHGAPSGWETTKGAEV